MQRVQSIAHALHSIAYIAERLIMDTSTIIEHQVLINAPVAIVWDVLTRLDDYPSWNRYALQAHGQLVVGGEVEIVVRLGNSLQRVNNRVLEVSPQSRLCWVSLNWYQFLVRGTRCRVLEPLPEGTTRFRETEIMQGSLARLVVRLMRPQLAAGLQTECMSIKDESERIARSS